MKKLWNLLIMLTVVFAGCNKTDDLWDEVHDLQKRLTKLEIQANNLNGNITALQELYRNGATITTVNEENGAYTITLSNGKILRVVQKMEETIYPMVGIDSEGYWTVRYGNETPERILVGNSPVKQQAKTDLLRNSVSTKKRGIGKYVIKPANNLSRLKTPTVIR